MSDTRKVVHELTDDELRREIAEATAWRVVRATDGTGHYHVYRPDGSFVPHGDWNIPKPWYYEYQAFEEGVPNWPSDTGAALTLCTRLGADQVPSWCVRVYEFDVDEAPEDIQALRFWTEYQDIRDQVLMFARNGSLPRALSELAALALRKLGGDV